MGESALAPDTYTIFITERIRSILQFPRPFIVFLFACLFVVSFVVHHEHGGMMGASSPKVEEQVCISFSLCSTPRRGVSSCSRYVKPISPAKDCKHVTICTFTCAFGYAM